MNELQIFANEKFGLVRIIEEDGKVLFCGNDICSALGYTNPRKALIDHCKGVTKRDTLTAGGAQSISFIPEGDVYRLIVSSKLPKAQEFEVWLFETVLPSIRKHGGYISGEEHMNDDELLAQAVLVAQRKLEERTAQLDAANKKIEKLEPKAAYFDTVASADGSTSFRETAKLFKVGEKTFTKFIEESNFCYRDSHKRLIPYAEHQKSGWFEVKEVTITTSTGIKTTIYTKITPKGRTEIFKRLQTAGILNPHGMEGTV
jgi:prophage antirepressor-like protein